MDHQLYRHLDRIERRLDDLIRLLRKDQMTMALIDDLLQDVQSQSTVIDSLDTLLTNLSKQLADALVNGDLGKLAQIKDALDHNTARIQADVTANTPAATP